MTMPARSCEAVITLDLLSVRILRLRRFGVAIVAFLAVVVILNLVGGLLRRTAARRHVPREKDRLDSCAYRCCPSVPRLPPHHPSRVFSTGIAGSNPVPQPHPNAKRRAAQTSSIRA